MPSNKQQIMDRIATVLLSNSKLSENKTPEYGLADHPRGYSAQEWSEEKYQRDAQKYGGF